MMMKEKRDLVSVAGKWDISFNYAAGKTISHFLTQMRDHRRILGIKCAKCQRVVVPPRSFCERCFVPAEDWVELGDEGVVEAFTIVHDAFEGSPPPPYAIAYVKLDGADTALANFVDGLDLSDISKATQRLKIGARVKVEFAQKREGRITDFKYRIIE